MGLLGSIVMSPLAPVRGVVALAGVIQRQVDHELHDPANTRRQLEDIEDKRQRGEISAEEEAQAQQQILESRLTPGAVDGPDEMNEDHGATNT